MPDGRFDEGFLRLMAHHEPELDGTALTVLLVTAAFTGALCAAFLMLVG